MKHWDGVIVTDHDAKSAPTSVQGMVTLPWDLRPGTTITGHLDGFVQFPEGSDGSFQDQETKVAIPVRVQVVSAPAFIVGSGLLALIVSLVALVAGGVILSVRRLRRLMAPPTRRCSSGWPSR